MAIALAGNDRISPMVPNDQEVVTRFLRGDREAVGTVDDWISRAAWPYQRRLATRWDDVLQDVRLEVTRLLSTGKFRGESSLRTYLWRVVSHTCLDQIRALTKWQLTDLEVLDLGDNPSSWQTPTVPSHEERDLLLRVLAKVSQDCKELWRMLVAGMSYREMSEQLGVAEGTLRVRVLRCREKATALRRDLLASGPLVGGRNIPARGSPIRSREANSDDL
jgi:RNA polymerase sigma factor (sigma-70 family)